jgi:hypothetical protein
VSGICGVTLYGLLILNKFHPIIAIILAIIIALIIYSYSDLFIEKIKEWRK